MAVLKKLRKYSKVSINCSSRITGIFIKTHVILSKVKHFYACHFFFILFISETQESLTQSQYQLGFPAKAVCSKLFLSCSFNFLFILNSQIIIVCIFFLPFFKCSNKKEKNFPKNNVSDDKEIL